MKKKSLFLSFIGGVCALCLCSFQKKDKVVPAGEYLICGELANVPDGAEIILYVDGGRIFTPVHRDTLKNGQFSFRDTITTTQKLLIMSDDKGFPGVWLDVWLAPGKLVKITGKDKLLKTWTVDSDIPQQKEENQFAACTADLQKPLMELLAVEYDLQREMFGPAHANDREFQKKEWVKVDSIRKLRDPLDKAVFKKELEYMKTAPIGPVWMDRLCLYGAMMKIESIMPYKAEVKELYARMSEAQKQTSVGQEITQYVFPPAIVNVGDEMVDGDLYDLKGELRHLSEFKGKYILMDFWSSGCGPCIQSIPEMEKITEMYKDKVAVISISEDPKNIWKDCIEKRKMGGNQWNELRRGRTGLSAAYQVKGIPHYVLISPDGKVQDMWGGYGPGSLLRAMEEKLK